MVYEVVDIASAQKVSSRCALHLTISIIVLFIPLATPLLWSIGYSLCLVIQYNSRLQ